MHNFQVAPLNNLFSGSNFSQLMYYLEGALLVLQFSGFLQPCKFHQLPGAYEASSSFQKGIFLFSVVSCTTQSTLSETKLTTTTQPQGKAHPCFSELKRKNVLGKAVSTPMLSKTKPAEHYLVPCAGYFLVKNSLLHFTSSTNKILSGSHDRSSYQEASAVPSLQDYFLVVHLGYIDCIQDFFSFFLLPVWVRGMNQQIACPHPFSNSINILL